MKAVEPHVHRFVRKATQKVNVEKRVGNGGTTSATDLILMRICECGKSRAYDLSRTLA